MSERFGKSEKPPAPWDPKQDQRTRKETDAITAIMERERTIQEEMERTETARTIIFNEIFKLLREKIQQVKRSHYLDDPNLRKAFLLFCSQGKVAREAGSTFPAQDAVNEFVQTLTGPAREKLEKDRLALDSDIALAQRDMEELEKQLSQEEKNKLHEEENLEKIFQEAETSIVKKGIEGRIAYERVNEVEIVKKVALRIGSEALVRKYGNRFSSDTLLSEAIESIRQSGMLDDVAIALARRGMYKRIIGDALIDVDTLIYLSELSSKSKIFATPSEMGIELNDAWRRKKALEAALKEPGSI